MSKVFNMVGGGGKNISSIIIIGLQSTDIVTCTKDGKSYTATWDSTDQHWAIVGLPLGTFTITATNGTKTTTETVLIDIAGVYEIELSYNLWIYNYGTEVIGGLGISTSSDYNGWIKNINNISITSNTTKGAQSTLYTNSTLDLSNYQTLYFDTEFSMTYHAYNNYTFGIYDSSGNPTSMIKTYEKQATVSRQTISIPITEFSGIENCIIKASFLSYQVASAVIHRIWAE